MISKPLSKNAETVLNVLSRRALVKPRQIEILTGLNKRQVHSALSQLKGRGLARQASAQFGQNSPGWRRSA